jgi:hypothetical protein
MQAKTIVPAAHISDFDLREKALNWATGDSNRKDDIAAAAQRIYEFLKAGLAADHDPDAPKQR